jgi:hypothetical protein
MAQTHLACRSQVHRSLSREERSAKREASDLKTRKEEVRYRLLSPGTGPNLFLPAKQSSRASQIASAVSIRFPFHLSREFHSIAQHTTNSGVFCPSLIPRLCSIPSLLVLNRRESLCGRAALTFQSAQAFLFIRPKEDRPTWTAYPDIL